MDATHAILATTITVEETTTGGGLLSSYSAAADAVITAMAFLVTTMDAVAITIIAAVLLSGF